VVHDNRIHDAEQEASVVGAEQEESMVGAERAAPYDEELPGADVVTIPSVFGRNLQCKPVREVNFRDECHWSHASKSFKRTCVGSNGILECKFLPENAHRAAPIVHHRPSQAR
jgi:hypothetical protein